MRPKICLTFLTQNTLTSRRLFSQGKIYPLHSQCIDLCDFPKFGTFDCVVLVLRDYIHSPSIKNKQQTNKRKIIQFKLHQESVKAGLQGGAFSLLSPDGRGCLPTLVCGNFLHHPNQQRDLPKLFWTLTSTLTCTFILQDPSGYTD